MQFFRLKAFLAISLAFVIVHGKKCGDVTLTGNSGILTSPDYPNEYAHELDCCWTIMASANNFVRLTFDEFDIKSPFLKCDHDYVSVDNGTGIIQTYCNNYHPRDVMMSEGAVMKVALNTDDFFRNGKGFKASYVIVDKDGNPLDKPDEEETDVNEPIDTVSTSTESKTSSKQLTTTSPRTTSVLMTKLSKRTAKTPQSMSAARDDNKDDGQPGDPAKTSGFVIGAIVIVIVGVILIVCAIAFSRYRKNKNKRISLNVIATPDDKELISNGKIYKKIGNKIIKDPEAETFPL